MLMVAVLLGIIYLRQDYTTEGVMNLNGALFLFLTNMTFQNAFAVVNVFCQELPIFLREHQSGMYRTDVYFLSKTIADLPFFILFPTIFSAVAYFMIGLNESVERFLVCTLIIIIVSNVSCSFGYMISCIANSVTMALSLAPPFIVPIMMFGGFFLNNASVPVYFVWLKYISWFYYGNEALMINQWKGVEGIECGDSPSCTPDGEAVLDSLNFDKVNPPRISSLDNEVRDILLLLALMGAFRIIAFLALYVRASRRK
ncbi:unnamed protein product [Darwinula stevensoni]|uniref:ABC-2 type transporter transmembrane domain-containing protein n=1 Tax=Darwinula stevensoni TaxID=69355 RepID=A0A7R9FS18_9CRUS|nr:unnamed protein product [Darwinula stevensoni]CAG0902373.1 unnamed protein product [Darwinula stevensoni]